MKRILHRGIIWLLTAVFFIEICAPAMECVLSAVAEEGVIPEAFSLEEAPLGEEFISGDWRYRLRQSDGYAVITGYDGSASGLIVPSILNGTDVVGLADGALADSRAESVSLHGNIMYIHPGAFGETAPVIRALNGSYALYYAYMNGMESVCTSEYELVPGVIDYTDAGRGRVKLRGERYAQINALEAMRLQVGSIFWYVNERGLIFFYRVTALEKSGDGVLASLEQPQIGEAVVEMHLQDTIYYTADDYIPAEGVEIVSSGSGAKVISSGEDNSSETFLFTAASLKKDKKCKRKDKITATGSVEDSSRAVYTMDVVGGEVVYFEVTEFSTREASISLKGEREPTLMESDSNDLIGELLLGDIDIPSSLFVLNAELTIGVCVSGEVEASWSSTEITTKYYDFAADEWRTETPRTYASANPMGFTLEGAVKGRVYVELKTTLTLFGIVECLELSLEIAFHLDLEGMLINSSETAIPCTKIRVGFFFGYEIYAGAWTPSDDTIQLGVKKKLAGESDVPIKVGDVPLGYVIHYDLDRGSTHCEENCPYEDQCTVFFDTRTPIMIDPVVAVKGEPLEHSEGFDLDADTGYGTLLGWTASPLAQEPDWIFGSTDYPVNKDMTLYAVWTPATTVEFDSSGGSAVGMQYVPIGGYASVPEDPILSSNIFLFWTYLADNGEYVKWNFEENTVPAEGIKLRACWLDGTAITEGTEGRMSVGNPDDVDAAKYAGAVSIFDYCDHTVVTSPDGKSVLGVSLTGVKAGMSLPKDVYVPDNATITTAYGETVITANLPILEVSKEVFQGSYSLRSVEFRNTFGVDLTGMFSGCYSLEYVNIINPVLDRGKVGSGAFRNCTALKCVRLPKGLNTIESYAFSGCTSLSGLHVYNGVVSIGDCAFQGCTGLKELYLTTHYESLRELYAAGLFADEALTKIGRNAFEGCKGITRLTIPDCVKSIGAGGFANCTGLREISIGGLDSLDARTFLTGSDQLEKLTIRNTVSRIENDAFKNLYGSDMVQHGSAPAPEHTAALYVEEGVVKLGAGAFEGCSLLTEAHLPDSLTYIDGRTFKDCSGLTEVQFGKHVETIYSSAFEGCSALAQLDLGNVTTIGLSAFRNCTSLRSVYIPDSVRSFGMSTFPASSAPFAGCTGLQSMSIGGVSTINDPMMYTGSTAMDTLVIRSSVKSIGAGAFKGFYPAGEDSPGQSTLIILDGLTQIADSAFEGCSLFTHVVLPDSVTAIGSNAFTGCTRLSSVGMSKNIQSIRSNAFYNCTGLKEISLHNVSLLGVAAFGNCTALEEIYVPDSIRTFGDSTTISAANASPFCGCTGLRRFSIGGLETISGLVLYTGSAKLEELTIRGSVKSIGARVLSNLCLRDSSSPERSVLILEEGVETIGDSAFEGCTLFTELILPDSLTRIGQRAFRSCSGLKSALIGVGLSSIGSSVFTYCSNLHAYLTGANASAEEYLTANGIPWRQMESGMFTLTLNANGGVFADGQSTWSASGAWRDPLDLTAIIPTNAEHLFSGWFADAQCTRRFTAAEMPAGDLEIYAGWDVDVYEISVYLGGGMLKIAGELQSQPYAAAALSDAGEPEILLNVPAGTMAMQGRIPVREGYCFTGWYLDPACTIPFDGVMPGKNCAIYAAWTEASSNAEYSFENGEATLVRYQRIEHERDSVYLPETVGGMPLTAIAADAFAGEEIAFVYLPASLVSLDERALYGMESLKAVYVNAESTAFRSVNGVLFSKDMSVLHHFPAQHGVWYTLPDGVAEIAAGAFRGSKIRSLIFCDTLQHIGASAFEETALSRVILPDSLLSLGEKAFKNCEQLGAVIAGTRLSEIGSHAFSGCDGTLMLYGPPEDCAMKAYADAYGYFYNYYLLTLNMGDRTGRRLVQAGTSLTLPHSPDMGENLMFTGWYADEALSESFAEGSLMPRQAMTLYAGSAPIFLYEMIESEDGTRSLTLTAYDGGEQVVTVPEAIGGVPVTAIAAGCFGSGLTRLVLPEIIVSIEAGAIPAAEGLIIECSAGSAAETYSLENGIAVSLPVHTLSLETNGGARIDPRLLAEGSTIVLPQAVRSGYAFEGWYADAELTVPVELNDAGEFLFGHENQTLYAAWTLVDEALAAVSIRYIQQDGCIIVTGAAEGAVNVIIPETLHGLPVTAIAEEAFSGNTAIQTAVIPGTISEIPAKAFRYCTSLAEIALEEGVSVIGEQAFFGCSSLKTLALPESMERILDGALSRTALETLTLNASLSWIAADALNDCSSLTNVYAAPDNAFYFSKDGVLYDLVDDSLVKYPEARRAAGYAVEEGVYLIGANAFRGARRLEQITLPDTVWEIGTGAFAGCTGLTELPDLAIERLNAIPEACFAGCSSLTEIAIPGNITQIGPRAFSGCTALELAVVPASTAAIGRLAFSTSNMVIQGAPGSAAEQFANENNILFTDGQTVILPEGIALNAEEAELQRGETLQLQAAILPENATLTELLWYTGDEGVAKVTQNGLVRAISDGETVIYAQTKNGLTAQCAVRVTTLVQSVQLLPPDEAIRKAVPVQLQAVVLPADAENPTLIWSADNAGVASITQDGVLTFSQPGFVTVTALAADRGTVACSLALECKAERSAILPARLAAIGEEAFCGGAMEEVVLPAGALEIGPRAFADCANLCKVVIPDSVTLIADDAFENSGSAMIYGAAGSEAEAFAEEHGIPFAVNPMQK